MLVRFAKRSGAFAEAAKRTICTKHMMLAAATATNPQATAQQEEEKRRRQEELADDLELLNFQVQMRLHSLNLGAGEHGQTMALTAHIETVNAQMEQLLDTTKIVLNPVIDIEEDMTGVRSVQEDIESDGYISY
jgi:hypothetical protein